MALVLKTMDLQGLLTLVYRSKKAPPLLVHVQAGEELGRHKNTTYHQGYFLTLETQARRKSRPSCFIWGLVLQGAEARMQDGK